MTNRIKLKGLYGERTRKFQRSLSRQIFQLAFKEANVYMYLGSASSMSPSIDDIQSTVFGEIPDRVYAADPVKINIGMDPMPESSMDFSRFGIISPMSNEMTIRIHIDEFNDCMKRWLIVGDVLEIPFFTRDCKEAFFEVTDVDDKPSYEKFYVTATIKPAGDTREMNEIPLERSNFDFNEIVQGNQDKEAEDMVPFEGIGEETDEQNPVDPRRKKQTDFLDDPFATFDDGE